MPEATSPILGATVYSVDPHRIARARLQVYGRPSEIVEAVELRGRSFNFVVLSYAVYARKNERNRETDSAQVTPDVESTTVPTPVHRDTTGPGKLLVALRALLPQ